MIRQIDKRMSPQKLIDKLAKIQELREGLEFQEKLIKSILKTKLGDGEHYSDSYRCVISTYDHPALDTERLYKRFKITDEVLERYTSYQPRTRLVLTKRKGV